MDFIGFKVKRCGQGLMGIYPKSALPSATAVSFISFRHIVSRKVNYKLEVK
jgi:hypothetical protein